MDNRDLFDCIYVQIIVFVGMIFSGLTIGIVEQTSFEDQDCLFKTFY